MKPPRLFNRELSWLSFNHRVLQEAMDARVPLLERLKFLAIYSANLDEFFRVRVAALRSLLALKKRSTETLDFEPAALLDEINRVVARQQRIFGSVFRNRVLKALRAHGVVLVDEKALTPAQHGFAAAYFREKIRPLLQPVVLQPGEEAPFLKNKALYLVTALRRPAAGTRRKADAYAFVEIPCPPLGRFVELPAPEGEHPVMFLDDLIRFNLPEVFASYRVGASWSIKLSRDAELYIDDEFTGNLREKIKKSLARRETGMPARFLYDLRMPPTCLAFLKTHFGLQDEDLVKGGRYHNFSDFFGFPDFGLEALRYAPRPPLPHRALEGACSLLAAVAEKDRMLHFPYQRFDYVVRFLEEAAEDPDVERLAVTLYRVAEDSAVVRALVRAAENGKAVTAFVEVKARFDEASNLYWAERLEKAGAEVLYSLPGLKVHTKLALITRKEAGKKRLYAYLSTGNFNEKTARLYADHGLFTADPRLTREAARVVRYLADPDRKPVFKHLLVAPLYMRKAFARLIDREIEAARAGRPAGMTLKLNSLEDPKMIRKLYEAGRAGVPIRIIVRGICCLIPGFPNESEAVTATSLVGRFLEHARVFRFHHGGEETLYVASADWMKRNLSRRIEVAFPVYDEDLRQELHTILALQLGDNQKARILNAAQNNPRPARRNAPPLDAQEAVYRWLKAEGS